MTPVRVVAIDGAAGSGKSTLARGLARALALPYLNTGLMYRALTRASIDRDVDPGDAAALAALMRTLVFALDPGDPPELSIDGAPPGAELEGPQVEAHVSRVAAHPQVRALMRDEQRRLGRKGAVIEGRDIGSVVFPDATLKLYLQADPQARGARRAEEREAGEGGGAVAERLQARDALDARVHPFVPPEDAVVIDTTSLDAGQVLVRALELVRQRAGSGDER